MIRAFLAPYKLWIELAVIGAVLAGAAVMFHNFLEHERDIGRNEVRAEYTQKFQEAKDQAAQREALLRAQVDIASKGGNDREQTIKTLAAAAGNASIGLRDTTKNISNSLSSLTADALRSVAGTYGIILGECQERRGGLAEEAERLNSEKRTLIEAWPTISPEKKSTPVEK